MQSIIPSVAVADMSAATGSVWKMKAPAAGRINLHESFLVFEELVGDATTQAVVSIEIAGVEVATYSSPASGGEAIGDVAQWTVDGTVATNKDPHVNFAAGDLIDFKLKTQASGGTTTGTARAYLGLEFGAYQV